MDEENESRGGKQRGEQGKANILSPPGTQLAAWGCCLYIRAVDRTTDKKKLHKLACCSRSTKGLTMYNMVKSPPILANREMDTCTL